MRQVQQRSESKTANERILAADIRAAVHAQQRYLRYRRVQDVVLSVGALVVLFPVLLLIALIIVLDDPHSGPIFTQVRVGENGREFKFYKFRTMVKNAEEKLGELLSANEMEGPAFKIRRDPRITRVGRFLRKSGLDELPQLYNILRGDMSFVGPRPPLPREVEEYTDYQYQRLSVQPGLTCYWQIQPHRNDMPFDEWVELDLKYIRERSFWVDWKIILGTFRAVLYGSGV